jgi:hypothetical protein
MVCQLPRRQNGISNLFDVDRHLVLHLPPQCVMLSTPANQLEFLCSCNDRELNYNDRSTCMHLPLHLVYRLIPLHQVDLQQMVTP